MGVFRLVTYVKKYCTSLRLYVVYRTTNARFNELILNIFISTIAFSPSVANYETSICTITFH